MSEPESLANVLGVPQPMPLIRGGNLIVGPPSVNDVAAFYRSQGDLDVSTLADPEIAAKSMDQIIELVWMCTEAYNEGLVKEQLGDKLTVVDVPKFVGRLEAYLKAMKAGEEGEEGDSPKA